TKAAQKRCRFRLIYQVHADCPVPDNGMWNTHYRKYIFMLHADWCRIDDCIILCVFLYITYEHSAAVLRVEPADALPASCCHSHVIAMVTVRLLDSLCSTAGTYDQYTALPFSETPCECIHVPGNISIIALEDTLHYRDGIDCANQLRTVIHLIQKFHYALFMRDCHVETIERFLFGDFPDELELIRGDVQCLILIRCPFCFKICLMSERGQRMSTRMAYYCISTHHIPPLNIGGLKATSTPFGTLTRTVTPGPVEMKASPLIDMSLSASVVNSNSENSSERYGL